MKNRLDTDAGSARIMTLQEAAEYLHTSYSTVYRLVKSGELDAFRLRNSWRTSSLACEQYVRHQFAEQALISGPLTAR